MVLVIVGMLMVGSTAVAGQVGTLGWTNCVLQYHTHHNVYDCWWCYLNYAYWPDMDLKCEHTVYHYHCTEGEMDDETIYCGWCEFWVPCHPSTP